MTHSLTRPIALLLRTNLLVTVCLLVTNGTVFAAQSDELPSAESILHGHIQATGGNDAHEKLKTRKMTGTFSSDIAGHKLDAKVVIQAKAPNKRYTSIEGENLVLVRVTDGKNAWEWNGGHAHDPADDSGETHLPESTRLIDGPEKKRTIEQGQFHANLNWRDKFKSVETVGIGDVNGRPAYEVQVTTKSDEKYSQFYDKESGRLAKVARTIESSQLGKMQVEILFNDYAKFDGVWLPKNVKFLLDSPGFGEGTQMWTYSQIKHNVEIPARLFKMPEELREQDQAEGQ